MGKGGKKRASDGGQDDTGGQESAKVKRTRQSRTVEPEDESKDGVHQNGGTTRFEPSGLRGYMTAWVTAWEADQKKLADSEALVASLKTGSSNSRPRHGTRSMNSRTK